MNQSKRLTCISLLLSTLTFSTNSYSSAQSDLHSFFNDLGYSSNVTAPSAYKGQSANYYNAGSVYVKSRVRNAQLVAVTMPSVSAGCNGIDGFMGAFSHISADELVQMGKSIIQNAPPFAVDLALQVWAPQIAVIKDKLQSIADEWLNQSINSCETAQALVGGLSAFAGNDAKKHVCSTLGTQNNTFADWVAARHECGAMNQTPGLMTAARNNPQYEDMTRTNHNIVWDALLKNAFLSSDKPLAEFLMSLSGMYIYDVNGKPKLLPSLFTDNNNMINAILKGGQVEVYNCDNDAEKQCINPTTTNITIAEANAFNYKILNKLNELYQALNNDVALNDSQKSFIEYSSLPILRMISNHTIEGSEPPLSLYSHVISAEILNRYMTDSLGLIRASLSATNSAPDDLSKIEDSINAARQFVDSYYVKAANALSQHEELIANQRRMTEIADKRISKNIKDMMSFRGM